MVYGSRAYTTVLAHCQNDCPEHSGFPPRGSMLTTHFRLPLLWHVLLMYRLSIQNLHVALALLTFLKIIISVLKPTLTSHRSFARSYDYNVSKDT